MSILAYKYRAHIGYYLMRTYSYMEIYYNRWYNKYYLNPDYKLFINGSLAQDITRINPKEFNENTIYTVEYLYKNKVYRISGHQLDTLLDYIENIDTLASSNETNPKKIYKWISAEDDNGNCYLDLVKKYAGPLGDFYKHTDGQIDIQHHHMYWLNGKKITLTDFRCDMYELDPSLKGHKVKLD